MQKNASATRNAAFHSAMAEAHRGHAHALDALGLKYAGHEWHMSQMVDEAWADYSSRMGRLIALKNALNEKAVA